MDLCDKREIETLLKRHGFHFSKKMGQNFLIAGWVPREIVLAAQVGRDCGVLEIGPGIGPLTVRLAEAAGKVAAVELDRSLLPILHETLAPFPNAAVVPGDILKLDLPGLVQAHFSGLRPVVCANLPYNITSPVLTALLECRLFDSITVMVQREVALRICAAPGTPDYGAFSVFCQYHAACALQFDVEPACFLPPPKVTSSVIRLFPREKPPEVEEEDFFFRVVRAAFSQRRKTLLNCLSAAFGADCSKEALRLALGRCALPEDIRGERLGIKEFALLARELKRVS